LATGPHPRHVCGSSAGELHFQRRLLRGFGVTAFAKQCQNQEVPSQLVAGL